MVAELQPPSHPFCMQYVFPNMPPIPFPHGTAPQASLARSCSKSDCRHDILTEGGDGTLVCGVRSLLSTGVTATNAEFAILKTVMAATRMDARYILRIRLVWSKSLDGERMPDARSWG
jgi:hypothetical protein